MKTTKPRSATPLSGRPDTKLVPLNAAVSPMMKWWLQWLCNTERRSFDAVVAEALEAFFNEWAGTPGDARAEACPGPLLPTALAWYREGLLLLERAREAGQIDEAGFVGRAAELYERAFGIDLRTPPAWHFGATLAPSPEDNSGERRGVKPSKR